MRYCFEFVSPKLLTDSSPSRGSSCWNKSYCLFHRLGHTHEDTFLSILEIGTQRDTSSSAPRTYASCNFNTISNHYFARTIKFSKSLQAPIGLVGLTRIQILV